MKVLKKVWLCVVLLMFASASFVAAQSADAENDVETLPMRFASCWQERGSLNAEESSIKQAIENTVDAYQKSELAKEYAEIDSMKEDLIAMGEYENERQYSEQKVAVMAGEMRNRLLEESSVRLDEITQRKNELDREIKELELVIPDIESQIKYGELLDTINEKIVEDSKVVEYDRRLKEGILNKIWEDGS